MTARLALVAATLAFAACAATVEESEPPPAPIEAERPAVAPPPEPQPPTVAVAPPVAAPFPEDDAQPLKLRRTTEVELLLSDFERLRRMSAADVAREQEAARQAFNQSRSDAARVRLAMAMTVPGIAGNDEVRALDLLDPLVKNPTAPLHGLAFLMAAYIQEQRRLASQVHGLHQNAQGLQQNVQALQQKLDALRSLERSLSEREAASRRKR